jgi:hypothetical protein
VVALQVRHKRRQQRCKKTLTARLGGRTQHPVKVAAQVRSATAEAV